MSTNASISGEQLQCLDCLIENVFYASKEVCLISELKSLAEAELNYAYFNAQRTSGVPTDGKINRSRANGVLQISDSSRPDSTYYNRAVVLPDEETIVGVLQRLPGTVQALELMLPQQNEEVFTCLQNAGFSPMASLCYLRANLDLASTPQCKVVELLPDQRDYFFDLLELSGAKFPTQKRSVVERFYCTERFRCFVAYDSQDRPAGWATIYIDRGTAFLANAFTFEEFRGRGFHSALLSTRLELARSLKLEHAFTDVEPASQSHRNCLRLGFSLLSVNSIWRRNSTVG